MEDSPNEPSVVSAVLGTFSLVGGNPIGHSDKQTIDVSTSWQQLGAHAQFAELSGTAAGLPRGYMADLFGRAAASGEQHGLALTAVRDAEAWHAFVPNDSQRTRRAMAGRAMAEMSGLWSVSAGHALANVVARVVRAHGNAAHLDKVFGWEGPPTPFAETRQAHLSLNSQTVKHMTKAAAATEDAVIAKLVQSLEDLVSDPSWIALIMRRDIGYHRWRPQSISGGAATFNPWVEEVQGQASMSVGMTSDHIPPTLEDVVPEARRGHAALTNAMGNVLRMLPGALDSVGVYVLRHVDDGVPASTDR